MGECRNCSQQYDGFEITLGKIIRFPSVLLEDRKGALLFPRFLFHRAEREKGANLLCDIIFWGEEKQRLKWSSWHGVVTGYVFRCVWEKLGRWRLEAGFRVLSVCVDVLLMDCFWNQKTSCPVVRKGQEENQSDLQLLGDPQGGVSAWFSVGLVTELDPEVQVLAVILKRTRSPWHVLSRVKKNLLNK